MDSRHSSSKTPCHQSYPCVASRKGNFADCDWFQCFLLCDAEKLGCPKMFSHCSAQRAAIRRRRAFCQITPSEEPGPKRRALLTDVNAHLVVHARSTLALQKRQRFE